TGAVEDDVGLLDTLHALGVAQEQAERLLGAAAVSRIFLLEIALSSDGQDRCLRLDSTREQRGTTQRFQVFRDMLTAGEKVVVAWQRLACAVGPEGSTAERCGVHAERGEQLDVAPLAEVLADATAVVDVEGELQTGGIEGRLQPNRAGTDDGE